MSTTNPLMAQAKEWADNGLGLALATVVETWGSSPCPAGSQMVINEKAGFAGSVSGGCIETSVVSESIEILKDADFEVAEYGVSGEVSFAAGLACGGTIRVMMEPLSNELLDELSGERPMVRAVDLESGKWAFVRGSNISGGLELSDEIINAVGEVKTMQRARTIDGIFLQPLIPPYRLFIIGAVRIAQSLAPMALEVGFDVTVIDPRRAFSTAERFPEINLLEEWPDKALHNIGIDAHTAVVTLTHDAKPDDMALGLALRSDAFYVGALGSKKTHAARTQRLMEEGYTKEEIGRISAPVGLDIGARTPAEIAVSILSELVATKNSKGNSKGEAR
ncbi:MAG: XdhC family protein [Rhodospirillaceae bacterium]|nr:XdhC family protein [Rhodospirillaceae bacterium]